jgi:pimeloyl-ACP methyl ester carboxylesterase
MSSAPKHSEGPSRPDSARLAVSLSRQFEAGSQPERGAESPFAKKTIRAGDGLGLLCEVRGQGDTALVFLHGWCGDREYWKHQVRPFTADYRVVTLDQAGHGESGKDRKVWSADGLAGDVEAVAKSLGLKRVIIVGHSMGGPVALLAAKRMPGTIVAVVGVDSLQNAQFQLPEEVRTKFLADFDKDFNGTMRVVVTGMAHEKTDAELKEWLVTRAEAQDPKMALALMRDLFSLDTVMECGASTPPAGTNSSPLRPSRPTRSTPTSVRSSSKASATTRCWRSRLSSTADSGSCSRSLRSRSEPVSPGTGNCRKYKRSVSRRNSRTKESAAIGGFPFDGGRNGFDNRVWPRCALPPDRAVPKLRRFTRGLTDNASMVHGDRESTAVCESTLIRILAPRWPKWSWRTNAISTRPITPQRRRRSPGQHGCRPNARRSCCVLHRSWRRVTARFANPGAPVSKPSLNGSLCMP